MIALVAKEDAVVLGAKAEYWRLDIPKLLGVALVGLRVARQRLEDLRICRAMGCSMPERRPWLDHSDHQFTHEPPGLAGKRPAV